MMGLKTNQCSRVPGAHGSAVLPVSRRTVCVPWLIYTCGMTMPRIYTYTYIKAALCDMTHPYVWHDSYMCDMTHPYVWHDSSIYVTMPRIYTYTYIKAALCCFDSYTWLCHSWLIMNESCVWVTNTYTYIKAALCCFCRDEPQWKNTTRMRRGMSCVAHENETWHIHMWHDMSHSYEVAYGWGMSHTYTVTYEWGMHALGVAHAYQ